MRQHQAGPSPTKLSRKGHVAGTPYSPVPSKWRDRAGPQTSIIPRTSLGQRFHAHTSTHTHRQGNTRQAREQAAKPFVKFKPDFVGYFHKQQRSYLPTYQPTIRTGIYSGHATKVGSVYLTRVEEGVLRFDSLEPTFNVWRPRSHFLLKMLLHSRNLTMLIHFSLYRK